MNCISNYLNANELWKYQIVEDSTLYKSHLEKRSKQLYISRI